MDDERCVRFWAGSVAPHSRPGRARSQAPARGGCAGGERRSGRWVSAMPAIAGPATRRERERVLSSPPVKLFTGGIATESNTFSPIPTGLDDYAIFRGSGRRPRSWARRSLPTPTTPSGRPTSSGSSPTPPPGGRGSIRQLRPAPHLSAARMENSFKRRPGGTRGNRDDEPRGRRGLEDPELVVEPRRPLSGPESRPVADVTLRQGGTSTSVVPRFDPRTDGSTRSVASRVAASPTSHTGDRPPIGTSVWTRGGDWRPGSAVAH